ncbi:UNVERIFIED_CONTAM: hypothetical protein B566_EDAN018990, partial [Ephemera danica]
CKNYATVTRKNPEKCHIKYHSFPKDPDSCKTWKRLCQREERWNPKFGVVCSVHFKRDDYKRDLQAELMNTKDRRILKPGAKPSLFLDGPADCTQTQSGPEAQHRSLSEEKHDTMWHCRSPMDLQNVLQYEVNELPVQEPEVNDPINIEQIRDLKRKQMQEPS